MCGIFGYVGKQRDAANIIFGGLKRLEYRGYDSWGVAVVDGGQIHASKQIGAIGDIGKKLELPESFIGIGHTRWATHGGITQTNAHPHFSSDKSFVLAQNGIVENFAELKKSLIENGMVFETETDTEVIVRLIEKELNAERSGRERGITLKDAVRAAFLKLDGRNTIILATKDGEVIAARNGSPLVVGVGEDEVYLSSDTLSFAPYVEQMLVVENGQMVACKDGKVELFDIKSGKQINYVLEKIDIEDNRIDKEGYAHFMLKEINESPYVIRQLLSENFDTLSDFAKAIKGAKSVYTLGCGTAGIAAAQIAFYLREFAGVEAVSLIGGDSLEYVKLFEVGDLIIAPSQSGETADVLEVLEIAKKKGVKIATLVNMQGSTMTRMSDFKFMNNAGPEVCVMSTKVFVSQIAWGYLVAKIVGGKQKEAVKSLQMLALKMEKYLEDENNMMVVEMLAKKLVGAKDIFLLGKYQNFNIVKEGMVKIIEGTYKHAHAIPAGDLKHYAITLMEKGVPVIFALSNDEAKSGVVNAISEVRARGAEVIGIAPFELEGFDYFLPVPDCLDAGAVMNVVPLQLLAYFMTVELGNNVDKPRNIAKSVTVK
ncbi:MAG TPA: glutamine--fructose-6-phosphate transaminase (isomerizing) [Candidatus Saccharimonadales bacterium]|nr:glutamine--fructose-6-phosphate transaminase (isomerizing) [Candidatus Saccharimonadales bacterium]